MPSAQQVKVDGRTLKLTNAEKVLYPAAGFTKAAVLDYYARVAEWLVPHFSNRPVTLRRFPDGVDGQAFYEKTRLATRPIGSQPLSFRGVRAGRTSGTS